MTSEETTQQPSQRTEKLPWLRLSITGVFMGLANLVPGVSGGTMVLALGLYDEFIGAMSDVTRFRFTMRAIIVLAMLFGIGFLTIALLAGVIEFLMEMFKPGMLALFIGMTLGGTPMLWREMKPASPINVIAALAGIVVMALIAFVFSPDSGDPSWLLYLIGGAVASSSMILPGISGSYMLLILGLYIPVIGGISQGVDALKARDFSMAFDIGFTIGLPLGLGLVIGIVAFSNLIKFCLDRFHKPTIGFLMGLLLGSVLGLYPFQATKFDKLPRYAQEVATDVAEDNLQVLKIAGYGWEAEPGNGIYENLMALEGPELSVEIVKNVPDGEPTVADVIAARESGSVMVVYDLRMSKEVRREATREVNDREAELVYVPNAEFTPVKATLVVVLMIVGFIITLSLGRLGKEKPGPEEASA